MAESDRTTLIGALAASFPDVMDQATCDEIYGPDTDRLDAPEEWYTSPRDLATETFDALTKAGYAIVRLERDR
jgi:hypothetical protein